MADSLHKQLSNRLLSVDVLDLFKFRGPDGATWTLTPQDHAWYRYQSGNWQPAPAPNVPMDGSIELMSIAMLPPSPAKSRKPEENEPTHQNLDVRQMLEQATRRVRDSYYRGGINSDEAESLITDLYLLDPVGAIWSFGIHTNRWYLFRQHDWEVPETGPNLQHFQSSPPKFCGNCGKPLNNNKFCTYCGTPIPPHTAPSPQTAQDVIVRFVESGSAPLPEPVVPTWNPAPGYPKITEVSNAGRAFPQAPSIAEPLGEPHQQIQVPIPRQQWKIRVTQGAKAGQSFLLGELTRLGRTPDNEIVLADKQSSRLHALIQQQGNDYVITDQGSTNGTFVNGVRIQVPTRLQPGATISIGNTHFVIEGELSPPATVAQPRPPQAAASPGTARSVPPASPPRKRNRWIACLSVLLLLLCCSSLLVIVVYVLGQS